MEYRQHASMDVLPCSDYFKHVSAMTAENLNGKAEIAEELAVRDMHIKDLEAQLASMTKERNHWREANRTSLAAGDILKEQLAAMTQERDIFEKVSDIRLNDLAASQAYAAQLREALEEVKRHGIEAPYPWAKELAQEALTIPQDDTALREWGAKLLEEMAKECWSKGNATDFLRCKAAELREKVNDSYNTKNIS